MGKIKAVQDESFIREIITLYHEGNFPEMKGLIMEYTEQTFFTDLYVFLETEFWRDHKNKYLTFVGITRQYFKIYT